MSTSHDPLLAAAAVLIAMVGSYAALSMAGRVMASRGRMRIAWLTAGGLALGLGIWSMHFTAMLAFHLPVPVSYDIPLVLLSMVCAVAASFLAMVVVTRRTMGAVPLIGGGLLMGPAIAGMHYIGMAAMRLPATISYDPFLWTLSVVIAVVVSWVALRLAFLYRDERAVAQRELLLSAVVMGFAISGMHFTGMAAARFEPDPTAGVAGGALLPTSSLQVAVVLGSLVLLGVALVSVVLGRRIERHFVEPLRDTEARFRALIEHSPVGVWQVDLEGRTLYANPALCAMLEVEGEEALTGRHDSEFFSPESLAVVRAEELKRADGEASSYEAELRTAGGRWRHVLVSGAPVFDSTGQLRSTMGSLVDVTVRKQLQAHHLETRKMESVGRLAGGIAHDFNNILTTILGAADLALSDLPSDAVARADVEDIRRAATKAARITRQLLTFSRRQVAGPEMLDLNDFLDESRSAVRAEVGGKIDVQVELASAPVPVRLARANMEHVVFNLVLNGRDAMPDGGTLTLGTRRFAIPSDHPGEHERELRPGEYAELSVSDSGVGMDEEVSQRLFEPFFTTKEFGKGTGLGLALVYGIVNDAGGALFVESTPGAGSTIRVTLPLATEEADGSATAPTASASIPPPH